MVEPTSINQLSNEDNIRMKSGAMKHEGSTIRLGNNSYSVAPGAEKRTLSAAAREVETTKDLKTKLKVESNKRKRSRNRCELA